MIQVHEVTMTDSQRNKVIANLTAALAMIGQAGLVLRDMGAEPLVIAVCESGKTLSAITEMFIAAQPEKPKEKTMATSTPKKTTTKKASKPLAKGLKAVKAMKPAKKVAK